MNNLSKINATAISRNLTTMTADEQARLQRGLDLIPVHKVLHHVEYLQNNLLPQLEKAKGLTHPDYIRFKSIQDALVWSINTNGYHDRMMMELSNERLLTEFYRAKCLFYERELLKYTTQEDLLYQETFMDTAKFITKGATVRFNPEPPQPEGPTPEEEEEIL